MSEVNNVRNTVSVLPAASSSLNNDSKATTATQSGQNLPSETEVPIVSRPQNTENIEAEEQERSSEQLNTAVTSIQDFVQNVQRDLQFSVDEELNTTVVKVIDGGSGEVIRQIPEQTILELARKLKESGELNLFNATG